MRRPLILPTFLALSVAMLQAAPIAARQPLSLGVSSQSSTDLAAVDAFTRAVRAKPALWTLWSTWGDRDGRATCSTRRGSCAFPSAMARGLRARGITPFIWWQPTDPVNPAAGVYERYQNIIKGKHDQYIRNWAKAAKAIGRPVIVRFAHEMNGNWFPWSLNRFADNTPERFKQAWRHIVTEFLRVDAHNVKFLWSPYNWAVGQFDLYYPGNAYVDYVGVTSLNWGAERWTSLAGLVKAPLAGLRKITQTGGNPLGKPIILPEVGSNHVGGNKAAWVQDAYRTAYKEWPAIRAMVYFDYDTTSAGQPDWRLAMPPGGAALRAYRSVASDRIFQASIP